jgi:predicted GIY-YIG superfamily endonuclease
MRPFFVYMLKCKDGSYYVGHTDDLERRMAEHHEGAFGGQTARRRPVELVWHMEIETRAEALERELQLKRWTRSKKEALIREDWAGLVRLSRARTGPDTRGLSSVPEGRPEEPETVRPEPVEGRAVALSRASTSSARTVEGARASTGSARTVETSSARTVEGADG